VLRQEPKPGVTQGGIIVSTGRLNFLAQTFRIRSREMRMPQRHLIDGDEGSPSDSGVLGIDRSKDLRRSTRFDQPIDNRVFQASIARPRTGSQQGRNRLLTTNSPQRFGGGAGNLRRVAGDHFREHRDRILIAKDRGDMGCHMSHGRIGIDEATSRRCPSCIVIEASQRPEGGLAGIAVG
jgi:hypothetical protein